MKIHILSDLHLEFGLPFVPPETDAEVVILAGDTHTGLKGLTWARETFPGKEIIYLLGNHEYYGYSFHQLRDESRDLAEELGIHLLDRDAVVLGDVRFLGATLWTDYDLFGNAPLAQLRAQKGLNDFARIHSVNPRVFLAEHRESRQWLVDELYEPPAGKTVVITHHAPSILCLDPIYRGDLLSAAFASRMDMLVANSRAEAWISGHTHTPVDVTLGETRLISNPKGYSLRGEPGFDPGFVLDI